MHKQSSDRFKTMCHVLGHNDLHTKFKMLQMAKIERIYSSETAVIKYEK